VVEFCSNILRAVLRRNYDVNMEKAACVACSATCSVGINTEIVL
jgi:streptolysin S family bacteriocin protoxin